MIWWSLYLAMATPRVDDTIWPVQVCSDLAKSCLCSSLYFQCQHYCESDSAGTVPWIYCLVPGWRWRPVEPMAVFNLSRTRGGMERQERVLMRRLPGRASHSLHRPEDVRGGAQDQVQVGGWQGQKQWLTSLARASSWTKIPIVRAWQPLYINYVEIVEIDESMFGKR